MARRARIAAMCLAVPLIGPWGCAVRPSGTPLTPPERVPAQVGSVKVASHSLIATPVLRSPTSGKGTGAAKGAGLGAMHTLLGGLKVGASAGNNGAGALVGVVLGVALAPVGALAGGVYGAIVAAPADKVKEAEAALATAVAELSVQEDMGTQVREMVRTRTGHRIQELVETDSSAGADDWILEVLVRRLTLEGPTDIDPSLSLVVVASARLIRAADRVGVDPPVSFVYRSVPRKFTAWGAEEARLFRAAMKAAYEELAVKIVDDTFVTYVPTGRRWADR